MKSMIIGLPFDNGIRSMLRFNRGITGADKGPEAVMKALKQLSLADIGYGMMMLEQYNLDVTKDNINDAKFAQQQKDATIAAHDLISRRIETVAGKGLIPIAIGGDHSLSYPTCRGLCNAHPGKKVGVIYIDSHFDMRDFDPDENIGGVISSGNPFRRLIEDDALNIEGKNVVAIGIHDSGSAIYKELEAYAKSKDVTFFYDYELEQQNNIDYIVQQALKIAGDGTDLIYFSVDIDAVHEKYVSGVSAPAANGLSDKTLYSLVEGIAKDNKVMALDVMEPSIREKAWHEILDNSGIPPRNEPYSLRQQKLEQTAMVCAKMIGYFLKNK